MDSAAANLAFWSAGLATRRLTLLVAAFVLLVLLGRCRGGEWRTSILHAATTWSLFAVLITEGLSIPRWLTAPALSFAWLAFDLVLIVSLCRHLLSTGRQDRATRPGARPSTRWAALGTLFSPPSPPIQVSILGVAAVAAIAFLVVVVGLVALVSPPNTWDAMQYHMPRVIHWIQNRSVAFYPTNELKQLHMGPGAEFLVLQWQVLSGGDRFANLVQWFAFVGSVVEVSFLARLLGAGARGQILAALLCATLPQGILYASAAKNDWVLAFWLVGFACYFFMLRRDPTWSRPLGASATLALACLTKSTAYIFIAPMVLAWIILLPRAVAASLVKRVPVALAVVLLVNASHFARNHDLYGSPLGPPAETASGLYKYANDRISLVTLVSNAVRNAALHLGIPRAKTSPRLEEWIVDALDRVGIDANDPATTWTDTRFAIAGERLHEALAGNPLHVILIALTLLTLLGRKAFRHHRDTAIYCLGLVLAFLVFCALLRWQPWHTRLHLPLFVLWSAPIAALAEYRYPRVVVAGVAALLVFLSIPAAFRNELRPLTGRASILRRDRVSLYFAERPELRDPYVAAAARVRASGCRRIGLDLSRQSRAYEYPMLVLLGGGSDADVRLLNVGTPSAKYASTDARFAPCAVLCVDCPPPTGPPSPTAVVGGISISLSDDGLRASP